MSRISSALPTLSFPGIYSRPGQNPGAGGIGKKVAYPSLAVAGGESNFAILRTRDRRL